KLGRGGIREIEFVAQAAQLLHAGRIPFLQGPQTLPTLQKMAEYQLLSQGEARDLAAAYCFLRDIEHRVQMEHNLQTHTIPVDPKSRERLARLMDFANRSEFDAALKNHHHRVRGIYEKFLKVEAPEPGSPFPKQFRGAEAEWKKILAEHRFRDVEKSCRLLDEFANGPGYVHVSQRTTDLARQLIPRILALCGKRRSASRDRASSDRPLPPVLIGRVAGRPTDESPAGVTILSDPDRVLARLD